jgi:hypothetical protein
MFCLAAALRSDRKEGCHFMIRSLLRFNDLFWMLWSMRYALDLPLPQKVPLLITRFQESPGCRETSLSGNLVAAGPPLGTSALRSG